MFYHNGCNPKLIKPLNWTDKKETLNLFTASLYIEDEYTHNHYNCLANRFYEALYCNVIPLFDKSCINTLEKSEISGYDSFIVENTKDIQNIINYNCDTMLRKVINWNNQALELKIETLEKISNIISR